MSTYLLLRNNQESGPFNFEEIKRMSLKSYDLLWIVGKSAAWRYPSEIAEFKSFAPPIPAQQEENPIKRLNKQISAKNSDAENIPADGIAKIQSVSNPGSRSVYVNLPAKEKKTNFVPINANILDPEINDVESAPLIFNNEFKPSKSVNFSSRILWIATIVLLFGAGILTGFFISDRRKYFSDDLKNTQVDEMVAKPLQAIPTVEKTASVNTSLSPAINAAPETNNVSQTSTLPLIAKKKSKALKNNQDTAFKQSRTAIIPLVDSTQKQRIPSAEDILYKKVKEHPENYVDLVTGKYSTGLFGGVSAVPISLTNNSPVKLDLVVVSVRYIQNNEKIYKTENISFFDVEPGETLTEKAPKSSRGIKISQQISIINSHQLDLHYVH